MTTQRTAGAIFSVMCQSPIDTLWPSPEVNRRWNFEVVWLFSELVDWDSSRERHAILGHSWWSLTWIESRGEWLPSICLFWMAAILSISLLTRFRSIWLDQFRVGDGHSDKQSIGSRVKLWLKALNINRLLYLRRNHSTWNCLWVPLWVPLCSFDSPSWVRGECICSISMR